MTDETVSLNEHLLGQFSSSDMQAYLDAKMPDYVCSACGEQRFDIMTGHDGVHVAQVRLSGREHGMFPTVGFFCENCGLAHLIYWDTFLQWLERR